eukprot:2388324-Alexandrium_andersonii.AAC.1
MSGCPGFRLGISKFWVCVGSAGRTKFGSPPLPMSSAADMALARSSALLGVRSSNGPLPSPLVGPLLSTTNCT